MKLQFSFSLIRIMVVACFFLLLIQGCDHGIEPKPVPPYGISGTIHFSHWPLQDSVRDLRVVVFKNPPTSNIILDILQGRARFSDSTLVYGLDSLNYTILLSPLQPGIYKYIVVAQQFGSNIFSDWRVVGEYELPTNAGHPASIFIPGNEIISNVNINVNFQDLPPQPKVQP